MIKTRSLDPLEPIQDRDHWSNTYHPETDFAKGAPKEQVEKLHSEKLAKEKLGEKDPAK